MEVSHATNRFYVDIPGYGNAIFTELGGLQFDITVMDYEEGGQNAFVHRLPGRTKVGNLVLKRGLTASHKFLGWFQNVMQGKIERKNISVIMYDVAGERVLTMQFASVFPVKWTGPQFQANGNAIAIETIELAHAGLLKLEWGKATEVDAPTSKWKYA